jgi:hypothetical protein
LLSYKHELGLPSPCEGMQNIGPCGALPLGALHKKRQKEKESMQWINGVKLNDLELLRPPIPALGCQLCQSL